MTLLSREGGPTHVGLKLAAGVGVVSVVCAMEPTQILGILFGGLIGVTGLLGVLVRLSAKFASVFRAAPEVREPGTFWTPGLVVFACMFSVLPSMAFVHSAVEWRARRWVESIVPKIEDYAHRHGAPPPHLGRIETSAIDRAWLHRIGSIRYVVDEDGSYYFDVMTSLTGGWIWGSERRVWKRYT